MHKCNKGTDTLQYPNLPARDSEVEKEEEVNIHFRIIIHIIINLHLSTEIVELLLLIHNNCGDVEKVLDRNGLRGSMKDSRLSIGLLNLILSPLPLGWGLIHISLPSPLKTTIKYTPE